MIDYSPKLEAPLIAPMIGDGPRAQKLIDVKLLTTARGERPKPAPNRAALIEARYHDWREERSAGERSDAEPVKNAATA